MDFSLITGIAEPLFGDLTATALTVATSIVFFLILVSGIAFVISQVREISNPQSHLDKKIQRGYESAIVREAVREKMAERKLEETSSNLRKITEKTQEVDSPKISSDHGKVRHIASLVEKHGSFAENYFRGFDSLSANEQEKRFREFEAHHTVEVLRKNGFYTKQSFEDLSFEEKMRVPKDRFIEDFDEIENIYQKLTKKDEEDDSFFNDRFLRVS